MLGIEYNLHSYDLLQLQEMFIIGLLTKMNVSTLSIHAIVEYCFVQ